jgi:hypothetical protein
MWPTRGLGTPFLWASSGLGRQVEVGLSATAAQEQDATGYLYAPVSTGYPIRNFPEPQPPRRLFKLTGSADQPQSSRAALNARLSVLAAAEQPAATQAFIAARFNVHAHAAQLSNADAEQTFVLSADEQDLEALLLLL